MASADPHMSGGRTLRRRGHAFKRLREDFVVDVPAFKRACIKTQGVTEGEHMDSSHTERSVQPRDPAECFFLLSDSSLEAEIAERRKRWAALQEQLHDSGERLERRYIHNAAVLPDVRSPESPAPPPAAETAVVGEPHDASTEDYDRVYCSVVDPVRFALAGRCNLMLGRVIKQRLWKALRCPTFTEEVQPNSRVQYRETFSDPTRDSYAPVINLDISGEPMPEPPREKRCRKPKQF